MRFHIPAIPHTITTPEYTSCAFTQKVVKLCKMLTARGHHVIHYGNLASDVICSENVAVVTPLDLAASYGDHDWRKYGWPKFNENADPIYQTFNRNTIEEIGKRKQHGDFLLLPFGLGHKVIADAHGDLLCVESGIGYPAGAFAPFCVYESYAVMHAYFGREAVRTARNDFWYSAVIPNQIDLKEFQFSSIKDNYFLFVGRQSSAKGLHIAEQMADKLNFKLVVAGPAAEYTCTSPNVENVGVVGAVYRARLLSKAKAVICASTFLEPFCGVQIEAMASGTPVISSDWGAFAEYNLHGKTGFRCRTFEHFLFAARNIGRIRPIDCRKWASKFSLEAIAPLYDEFFLSVQDVYDGGWYQQREKRVSLVGSF